MYWTHTYTYMNSVHGVAGGRRRRDGGEGAKRKGNDEPDAMVRSDVGKTHRGSEERDEHVGSTWPTVLRRSSGEGEGSMT